MVNKVYEIKERHISYSKPHRRNTSLSLKIPKLKIQEQMGHYFIIVKEHYVSNKKIGLIKFNHLFWEVIK